MTNGAHFEIAISDLKEHIKADKSIIQPWRNKAIARLEEAQAFIRMGVTSTNRPIPPDMLSHDTTHGFVQACSCRPGMTDKGCPVHGAKA